MIRDKDRMAIPGDHLVHVRHRLIKAVVAGRDYNNWKILIDERDWPMLKLSSCITFSVNVGYFF